VRLFGLGKLTVRQSLSATHVFLIHNMPPRCSARDTRLPTDLWGAALGGGLCATVEDGRREKEGPREGQGSRALHW
jgi:hypothetical protein